MDLTSDKETTQNYVQPPVFHEPAANNESSATRAAPFVVNVVLEGGHLVEASSADLCLHSEIFRDHLDKQQQMDGGEIRMRTLRLPRMKVEVFLTLNDFFTTGQLQPKITMDECLKLIDTAQVFKMEILKEHLMQEVKDLIEVVDVDDVFKALNFARDEGIVELYEYTVEFICSMPFRFLDSHEFYDLRVTQIWDILESDRFHDEKGEISVFRAAIGWARWKHSCSFAQYETAAYFFMMVLRCIRFQLMSPSQIYDMIENYSSELQGKPIEVMKDILIAMLMKKQQKLSGLLERQGIKPWHRMDKNKKKYISVDDEDGDNVRTYSIPGRGSSLQGVGVVEEEATSNLRASIIGSDGGNDDGFTPAPSTLNESHFGGQGASRDSDGSASGGELSTCDYEEEGSSNSTGTCEPRDVVMERGRVEKNNNNLGVQNEVGGSRNNKEFTMDAHDGMLEETVVVDMDQENAVENSVDMTRCFTDAAGYVPEKEQPVDDNFTSVNSLEKNTDGVVPESHATSDIDDDGQEGAQMDGNESNNEMESIGQVSELGSNSPMEEETDNDMSISISSSNMFYYELERPRSQEEYPDFFKLVDEAVQRSSGESIGGVNLKGFKLENSQRVKVVDVSNGANITVDGVFKKIEGEEAVPDERDQSLLAVVKNFNVLDYLIFKPENWIVGLSQERSIWRLQQNILLRFNGITFLNVDHKAKMIVVNYLRQANAILSGCGDSVKTIGVSNCQFDLSSVPSRNAIKLFLHKVWGPFELEQVFEKFRKLEVLSVWKFKPEMYFHDAPTPHCCATLKFKFSDKNFPFTSLKELVLARVEIEDFRYSTLRGTNIEILKMDECTFSTKTSRFKFCYMFPKLFPKLKKILLKGFNNEYTRKWRNAEYDVTTVHSVYGALQIPSLMLLRVMYLKWEKRNGKCVCNKNLSEKLKECNVGKSNNFLIERGESEAPSTSNTWKDGWKFTCYQEMEKKESDTYKYSDMCDKAEYEWHHLDIFFSNVEAFQNYFIPDRVFPNPQPVYWI